MKELDADEYRVKVQDEALHRVDVKQLRVLLDGIAGPTKQRKPRVQSARTLMEIQRAATRKG